MKKKNKKYLIMIISGISLILIGYLGYTLFVEDDLKFKKNEEMLLEGAKKYFEQRPGKLPSVGGYRKLSLEELYSGKWVEALDLNNKLCSEKSFVRVVNDNGNYRYTTYLKCGKYESNIDASSPEIVLNGESTVIVHLNTPYQDLGVKEVKDNIDNIKIEEVEIDASGVNTSKVGTYEVTYKVHDKSYNVRKTSRTVIVAETLSDNIKRNKGANYTYTGDISDNFVLFSGMMFRIVGIDNEGNIKLITDNGVANVSYGNEDYKDSNIYTWLNEYFYSHINEKSKKYMKEVTWCYDYQETPGVISSCNNQVNAKVGLLSVSEYERSKRDSMSYLVEPMRYAMLNKKAENSIWVNDVYYPNKFNTMKSSDLTGVRPVIVIDKSIFLTGGNGTLDNPFKLQDYTYGKENEKLNTRLIGEYVHYSGYNFRISGIDKDGNIKLTGADLLTRESISGFVTVSYKENDTLKPDPNEKDNLYYKLNNETINYLKDDSIVSHEFEIPIFQNDVKYNEFKKTTIKSKLSIPASYEIFSSVNNQSNNNIVYWLSDYTENEMATIINTANGLGFSISYKTFPDNGVKPVIYLKNDTKIASGNGSVSNPYYVR